jgi:hypothetical protein
MISREADFGTLLQRLRAQASSSTSTPSHNVSGNFDFDRPAGIG